jgi:hypothetical protein
MLYLMLMIITFLLFFHWFDIAFRSRTFARSLYVHFITLGVTLGLAFCTHGIPGLLFPLAVMGTTVFLSNRPEILKDVHYTWLLVPLGSIMLLWSILGGVSLGIWDYLKTIFMIRPDFHNFGEPVLYLLPVLPLLFPALLNKDMWNRAIISYQKGLFLLFAWVGWSVVFMLLCSDCHETFALLTLTPAILWIGFYLSEVFRNPLFPFSLQLVVDSLILMALIVSVCIIILTMQLVPPQFMGGFILLTIMLPVMAVILLVLRDFTISRVFPFYIIPCSLLLCILAKNSLVPMMSFHPAQDLALSLHAGKLTDSNAAVLEWESDQKTPSVIRFLTPLKNKVTAIHSQETLESMIQTRQGPVYLILPEPVFYGLPASVRENGFVLAKSWHWKEPMTLWTLLTALQNETMDFQSLSEPVYLYEVPINPEDI